MGHTHSSFTVDEALLKMQRYCAYQERCHQEVRKKLQNMRMIPQAIDTIMVKLIEDGFLDESRFAIAYVRGKFRVKKWGKQRLFNELRKRDISKFNINTALAQIDEAEYIEVFHKLAEKRWNSLSDTSSERKKRKFADYMLYRGWESHLVYEKIRELSMN